MAPVILWFRRDLRLGDHPALAAAAAAAGRDGVVALFVADPAAASGCGPNRRQFLLSCLASIDRELGGRLVVRGGPPAPAVAELAADLGASCVFVTADFGPYGRRRDAEVADRLARDGRRLVPVGSPYLVAPGRLRGVSGHPYRVFTPYLRAWSLLADTPPVQVEKVRWATGPGGGLEEAGDVIGPSGSDGEAAATVGRSAPWPWWSDLPVGMAPALPDGGEGAAHIRLQTFVADHLAGYATRRDRPDLPATSGLSPDLHLGAVHPRTILQRVDEGSGGVQRPSVDADRLAAELAWRDFYADVLWHHPRSAWSSLSPAGRHLRFDTGPEAEQRFRSWALGTTGYPLVDAGMRQLLAEGFMHNRVRMVTASFLVKDLHLDWRWGARWFLWHLVDGDLASNNHGWQWVAGTGTDAAPFHRVFNPERQQQRFDPDGAYVQRYVPEAGGFGYPTPIVDHATERAEALHRWEEAKAAAARTGDGGGHDRLGDGGERPTVGP